MKKIIIYYSFSGKTAACAHIKAAEEKCECFEVKEAKKRSKFGSFLPGCPQAIHMKCAPLAEPIRDISDYDTIILMSPIWAGHPAPAFNSVIKTLPPGKNIEIIFTSAGGDSSSCHSKVKTAIENAGCILLNIKDEITAQKNKPPVKASK